MARLGVSILNAQAADANRFARRCEQQLIAKPDLAGESRTGDDGAGTGEREAAVDGEAKAALPIAVNQLGGDLIEVGAH